MSIAILDSTLREGEQTPYVSFTVNEKIEIAKLLDEFGAEIIEVGHPAVSPSIRKAVEKICMLDLRAEFLVHCMAVSSDIDYAHQFGADWVGIFYSLKDKRMEEMYRKSEEDATRIITDTIKHAKQYGLKVRYTPEDTVRSDFDRVVRVARAAVQAGADRISIADTAGCMLPWQMYDYVLRLSQELDVDLHVHCHNDKGMATANSIAAYRAGASVIDVTVNGLGERTGIASLASVCTLLKHDFNVTNEWNFDVIQELSSIVEKYSAILIPEQEPFVGGYAFTHNAGLHVSAVLSSPDHYENGFTDLVGGQREIIIDKFVSKPALQYKLDLMGIELPEEFFSEVISLIKNRDSNVLGDSQIVRIIREVNPSVQLPGVYR